MSQDYDKTRLLRFALIAQTLADALRPMSNLHLELGARRKSTKASKRRPRNVQKRRNKNKVARAARKAGRK